MNSQSLFIIEAKKQGYSQLKTSLFFFPQIKITQFKESTSAIIFSSAFP